jgi:hypothetical protein
MSASCAEGALCPTCRGRGFRIVTQDGTRPACISCGGSGRLSPLAPPPPAEANAAGHLPPARAPSLSGRRPFLAMETAR